MITQERLKELFHYNPDTGIFTRRVKTAVRVQAGDVLGFKVVDGYIRVGIKYKTYLVHRLAFLYMTGSLPSKQCDHINHIRSDNRWINLRDVSSKENGINKSKNSNNKSGTTGVYWHVSNKKWAASISKGRKREYLGSFTCKDEAIKARKEAEAKYCFHKNHGSTK